LPGILRQLLSERGEQVVSQACIEALGYPLNMVRDSNEVKLIRKQLEDPKYPPF